MHIAELAFKCQKTATSHKIKIDADTKEYRRHLSQSKNNGERANFNIHVGNSTVWEKATNKI